MTQVIVVALALLAALCAAVGIVVRQLATRHVPAEHGMTPAIMIALVRNPLWWAGTGSAVVGYLFQALALTHGSLLLVQPLLASALIRPADQCPHRRRPRHPCGMGMGGAANNRFGRFRAGGPSTGRQFPAQPRCRAHGRRDLHIPARFLRGRSRTQHGHPSRGAVGDCRRDDVRDWSRY
jgi:hypothetical protein